MLAAPQDEKAPQPLTETLMIDQTSSVSPAAEETAPSQSMGRRWGSLDSVSYTHLDVYKRQA